MAYTRQEQNCPAGLAATRSLKEDSGKSRARRALEWDILVSESGLRVGAFRLVKTWLARGRNSANGWEEGRERQ